MKSFLVCLSIFLMLWNSTIVDSPVLPELIIEKTIYIPPSKEKFCLAKAIYFEARNQNEDGRIGVATVVLNRVRDWNTYSSVCQAVFDKCNFTWACSGLPRNPYDLQGIKEKDAWCQILKLAEHVMVAYNSDHFKDLTHGATYFHTVAMGKPWWAFEKNIVHTVNIESHVFYKRVV